MKLYYFPTSHWSRIVHLVVRELELDCQTEVVDLRTNANFEPQYLALNPRGVVPTLDAHSEIVWDGRNIVRHLDARHAGGRLWERCDEPAQAWTQELHDFPVMLFSYSVWVLGARGERSEDILADKLTRARDYAERYPEQRELYLRKAAFFEAFSAEVYDDAHVAAQLEHWRQRLEALGELLRTRPWIGGEQPGFADCMAAATLARLVDLERAHDWYADETHPLRMYMERWRERASYRHVFYEDPNIEARLRLREPAAS